jgi:hypothetical protein
MRSLARIEVRHLARSPLLWLGVTLAAAFAALELSAVWPVLAGDDLFAYRDGFVVGGGALLAGAWLALRERSTGAADLVAVTPTAPWRLQGAAGLCRGGGRRRVRAGVCGRPGLLGRPRRPRHARSAAAGRWGAGGGAGRMGRGGGRPARLASRPAAGGVALVALLFVASLSELSAQHLSVQRLSPVLSFEDRSACSGSCLTPSGRIWTICLGCCWWPASPCW